MQWLDVQQNTDDWLQLRVGRIGGSSLGTIMANYGKAFGNPAHALAVQIALEQIKGKSYESGYTNAHMERGHEQEPIARMLYEREYFCDVTNGGYFIEGDDIGVSPDGLIGSPGVAEIKCVIASVHFDTVKRGKYDPKYKWQLCHELKVPRREWVDCISFCDEFPEGKKLFVDRVFAKDLTEEFDMIDLRLHQFRQLVAEKKAIINRI